jgi:hypothetical protein
MASELALNEAESVSIGSEVVRPTKHFPSRERRWFRLKKKDVPAQQSGLGTLGKQTENVLGSNNGCLRGSFIIHLQEK